MSQPSPPPLSRRSLFALLGASVLTLAARRVSASESAPPGPRLYVQPLGPGLSEETLMIVRRALETFYAVTVIELSPVALPKRAYYPPRQRYRAESLLEFLESSVPPDAYRILGLTSVDISTTKGKYADWGILGLATLDGKACVLSGFRCKKADTSDSLASARLGKTAVHEIGHTLGLDHCPTYGCLMEDARGTVTTTDREYDLCDRCRKKLAARGRPAHSTVAPPWPKPHSGGGTPA